MQWWDRVLLAPTVWFELKDLNAAAILTSAWAGCWAGCWPVWENGQIQWMSLVYMMNEVWFYNLNCFKRQTGLSGIPKYASRNIICPDSRHRHPVGGHRGCQACFMSCLLIIPQDTICPLQRPLSLAWSACFLQTQVMAFTLTDLRG